MNLKITYTGMDYRTSPKENLKIEGVKQYEKEYCVPLERMHLSESIV